VAAILSVVESCRRLKVPVRDYLADILPGLANTSIQRGAELTPAAWIARHNPANLQTRPLRLFNRVVGHTRPLQLGRM
jgi:hypothetical protein